MPKKADSYISLFNAKDKRIKGMRSAVAPAALGEGEYALIQNWRWDRIKARVRDGVAELSASAIIASGAYRGHWNGQLNGTEYLIVAYSISSKVRLYSVSLSTWAGTEVTAASGPYDETRFSNTTNFVSFAVARDRTFSKDILICSNGSDDPRVYDPQGMVDGTHFVVTHSVITPPTDGMDMQAVAKFPAFASIGGATPTFSSSDGDITFTNSSAGAAENHVLVTLANSTDNADSAEVTFPSSIDPNNSTMVYFYVETASLTLWETIKIEFRLTSTSYKTIYDGSSSTNGFREEIFVAPDRRDRMIVAIPLINILHSDLIDRMRLTYVGDSSTTAEQTMKFYGIFFSGGVPGGSEFGITYGSFSARSESVGFVIGNMQGEKLSRMGATSLSESRIPILGALNYQYTLRAKTTSTASNVDNMNVYVKRPGDIDFLYNSQDAFTEWSGSAWGFASGATGGFNTINVGDTGAAISPDPTLTMPDEYHKPIPKARYLHNANDRMFAGNISGGNSQVWFSEDRNPFKWRKAVRQDDFGIFDPRSPGYVEYESETVQGFASVPASLAGLNTVYTFTDLNLYESEGMDAFSLSRRRRKALLGTLSPRSIRTYRAAVYWVDNDMQARELVGGQINDLSRYDVDDKLQAVPAGRRDDIVGEFFKDRYYIGYSTANASTNDRILIWNGIERVWEADDKIPTPCTAEGLGVRLDRTNNIPKLLSFGSDAKIYEYEQKDLATDLGAGIATVLTTGELTSDMWAEIYVACLGFVMDDTTSGTITVVVTYKPHGGTSTFAAISVDVSTNQAQLWISNSPTQAGFSKDAGGVAAQIQISGTLRGGKALHSIVAEIEEHQPVASTG
jgi:hypothetical protein